MMVVVTMRPSCVYASHCEVPT